MISTQIYLTVPRNSAYRFVVASIIIGSYLWGLFFWALASSTLFFGGLDLSRELKKE